MDVLWSSDDDIQNPLYMEDIKTKVKMAGEVKMIE